jgi:hypothetical protein
VTIRRILGPGESELSCEECFDELDRYVELTLAGSEADVAVPGMRAHLDGCPACEEEFESLRALLEASPRFGETPPDAS